MRSPGIALLGTTPRALLNVVPRNLKNSITLMTNLGCKPDVSYTIEHFDNTTKPFHPTERVGLFAESN